MMRGKTGSAMQKTYDDCYLVCSTAIYFENQNNETEALRSWKSALDQIYYFNAYRLPSTYRPKTETERSLHTSLKDLELQCKERVDILEALKRSRAEASENRPGLAVNGSGSSVAGTPYSGRGSEDRASRSGWLGDGTVAPIDYPQLGKPPVLPPRPGYRPAHSWNGEASRTPSHPTRSPLPETPSLTPSVSASLAPTNSYDSQPGSAVRTPSPNKRGGMLRTLRTGPAKEKKDTFGAQAAQRLKAPAGATKAATQAWASPAGLNSTESLSSSTARLSVSAASVRSPRPSIDDSLALPRARSALEDTKTSSSDTLLSSRAAALASPRVSQDLAPSSAIKKPPAKPPPINYRREYPRVIDPRTRKLIPEALARSSRDNGSADDEVAAASTDERDGPSISRGAPVVRRKEVNRNPGPKAAPKPKQRAQPELTDSLEDDTTSPENTRDTPSQSDEDDSDGTKQTAAERRIWNQKCARVLKRLPKSVDQQAAQQILNEIVIKSDEVHWEDIAGLEAAKGSLKETVVYPFLRPDLFMGLREPARGMLLFGPPGTGKTMLARAVATESRSTFFAISASSLTSKFLGESEKLVRALFELAKALAPSIIFVDEIDSLLSARGGGSEHEATRRIKTEFLIQWSDLARAAAGKESTDKEKGDASRVLVLAATNLPWAIDEAARRRFVRRQYIPLPEDHVRATQLKTLLSHQKQDLTSADLEKLVQLTDGFSGSDITALAKDAAMGPLRSLGEKLLHMTMDDIRPINFCDFEASLVSIRPSVSKQGLKEFEDWARDFGERGG